jgi:hypothetical protein
MGRLRSITYGSKYSPILFFYLSRFFYIYFNKQSAMQEEKIQPIINGRVNTNLTPELFKELDKASKRQVIWNIIVSLGFAHSFPEVDAKLFEPSEFKVDYKDLTYDHPNGEIDLDKLFIATKEEYKIHHRRMKVKTADAHYELGRKIYQIQGELGFGGMLELDKNRLKGYISACGDWNKFNASKVGSAVSRMHELAPRMDYGPNNCNTGSVIHKFKTVHGCEYIILSFEFISSETMERVKEFYRLHWEPKGRSLDADSVRFEETDHGNNYHGIELIWWWD